MTNRFFYLVLTCVLFMGACSSPKYFHDKSSLKRQKEIKSSRSANIVSAIGEGMLSIFSSSVLETDVGWNPSEKEFKKLKLINPTADTMYINLLTDVFWDKNDYCDFMDIRIPPKTECRVLVPLNASYNLYFSNTPQDDDDEMLEIYTTNLKQVSLYPGITVVKDSLSVEQ